MVVCDLCQTVSVHRACRVLLSDLYYRLANIYLVSRVNMATNTVAIYYLTVPVFTLYLELYCTKRMNKEQSPAS
ncbi:hypothetical protein BJX96DRAFT_62658 [Aspergillus floccosus]